MSITVTPTCVATARPKQSSSIAKHSGPRRVSRMAEPEGASATRRFALAITRFFSRTKAGDDTSARRTTVGARVSFVSMSRCLRVFARALAAGGTLQRPLKDEPTAAVAGPRSLGSPWNGHVGCSRGRSREASSAPATSSTSVSRSQTGEGRGLLPPPSRWIVVPIPTGQSTT